jgi:hypothetical protein
MINSLIPGFTAEYRYPADTRRIRTTEEAAVHLANLRIRTKLLLLIGLMTAVTAVVATIGVMRLVEMNDGLTLVGAISDKQILGAGEPEPDYDKPSGISHYERYLRR